jgi:hypothetical protein
MTSKSAHLLCANAHLSPTADSGELNMAGEQLLLVIMQGVQLLLT